MRKIVNKFLLAGDKFIPEWHLRQPGFTYSACRLFNKHHEKIQKFREQGDLNHIYKNLLNKPYFPHDAAYSDSEDLVKRTISDKILKNRAPEIAGNPKYNGYQRGVASMVYEFFEKN